MSNLYYELDDVYKEYYKPSLANKITKTEVLNKINTARMQCEAISSYMLCFEREWNFPTEYYVAEAQEIIDKIKELEGYFKREVPNDLSKLIST